jgi:hypothetical protein
MSEEERSPLHAGVMSVAEPQTLLENRMSLRYILAGTIKQAYEKLIEEKAITKEQIAYNMKEKPVVIDALLNSMDIWSIDMMADFLWGMSLRVSGIMLGTTDHSEEDEENENERIH